MKRISLVVSSVVCAGGVALAADVAPRPLQGDLVHGKQLYDQHCMSCHGFNGMGGQNAESPRLTDSGRLNALTNEAMLALIRESDVGGGKKKKSDKAAHFKLPSDSVSRLDAWDIIGFLRARTVEVPALWPEGDRYLAGLYKPDQYALERLSKSTGKPVTEEAATFHVFTVYKTGWGGQMSLLKPDPKVLDKLKKNMKQGYVVTVPLNGQKSATDVVLALDPKNLSIVNIKAMTSDGTAIPELDKQLQRFIGKGDRRVSGTPKASLKAGGGGKDFAALEANVTESFMLAAEAVTAYEIQERERSWADDDL